MSVNFGLPTHDDTLKAVNYTEAHILDALNQLEPTVEYRVACRELSLTRTKLQEALMWLRESRFYAPEIKSLNHPYPYQKHVTGTSHASTTEGQANNAPQHHHRVDDDPPSE